MTETAVGSERREQLLAAADRVVQREGSAASMNLIAAEAGITKPILYRHFGDKGGLYRALAERHIEELLERLRTALLTRGGLRARTNATVEAYLAAVEEQPQVYRFLLERAAVEEPDVRGQVVGFVRRFGDELAVGIGNEPELGAVDPQRAVVWAHAIAGMVQATGDWWLGHPDVPRRVVVDELVALLWEGFTGVADRGRAGTSGSSGRSTASSSITAGFSISQVGRRIWATRSSSPSGRSAWPRCCCGGALAGPRSMSSPCVRWRSSRSRR